MSYICKGLEYNLNDILMYVMYPQGLIISVIFIIELIDIKQAKIASDFCFVFVIFRGT